MNYINAFREATRVKTLVEKIKTITHHRWQIMEVCGGQTHSIKKYGLMDLLPDEIELIHGPGCPVCVTPKVIIDTAVEIAKRDNVIFCTFGDMMRVPGSEYDLLQSKAQGADVRMMYSPLEAITLAQNNPDKEVVLLAVGFETTAPAHAMAVFQANELAIQNFSTLTSLVLVPPAIQYLLEAPHNTVQGFLAAGHVCTIMGDAAYHPISRRFRVPIVITGFEPVDILQGIYHCIKQLENKEAFVENQYTRMVKEKGNPHALNILDTVYETIDMPWRGIGPIPQSGYQLRQAFRAFDAAIKFGFSKDSLSLPDDTQCISGAILQGQKKPYECPLFGKQCTPEHPVGAPMVSHEGACSAYYLYSGMKHVS